VTIAPSANNCTDINFCDEMYYTTY